MARLFDGVDDVIRWSIGALTGTNSNATYVAIMRRGSDTTFDTILGLHNSGGTVVQWFNIEDGDNVQLGNGTGWQISSFTLTSADGWVLIAVGKATGTTTPRFHKYVFSTNTWTHSDGSGTLANGDTPNAGGWAENSWQGADPFHGDVAAAGVFTGQNLSDAQVESLAYSLTSWYALAPTAMWVLDQSATTQSVPDLTGGGANQSSLTGTAVSSSSVPTLGYGASPVARTVTAAPPAPPPMFNPVRRRMHLLVR